MARALTRRPVQERPKYATLVGEYFGLPLRTKADVVRYAYSRQQRLLADWERDHNLSIYDDPDYVWDALQCYEKVSTASIVGLGHWLRESGVDPSKLTLVDVWNGVGLTSLHAAQLGLQVHVVNTCEAQLDLGRFLQRRLLGYELPVVPLNTDRTFDIVASFEALEHYYEPLPHLERLLELRAPGGALAFSTGFTDAGNVGHYTHHLMNGTVVENRQVPRLLNAVLKNRGLSKVFDYFNGRPRVWV